MLDGGPWNLWDLIKITVVCVTFDNVPTSVSSLYGMRIWP